MKGRTNMFEPMKISLFEYQRYFPWLYDIEATRLARAKKASKAEEVLSTANTESTAKAEARRSQGYSSCQKVIHRLHIILGMAG